LQCEQLLELAAKRFSTGVLVKLVAILLIHIRQMKYMLSGGPVKRYLVL
jgi:hypothetical protein